MAKSLVEMASDIVQAQSQAKNMTTEEITYALQQTFNALQSLQHVEAAITQGVKPGEVGAPGDGGGLAKTAGALNPEKSIQKSKIICLECNQEFRMLSPKHLKSHGLTGREYREKHGFSLRQPLCARNLSEMRKKAGRERGLPDNLMKAIKARRKKVNKKALTEP